MKASRWLKATLATLLTVPLVVASTGAAGAAQTQPPLTAVALLPDETIGVVKAPTSRLAETDPALLGRTDSTRIPVLAKLAHDAVATYTGEVPGLAATSPSVTGRGLSGSAAERRYERFLAEQEAAFISELQRAVPSASVSYRYRTIYGGVAITLPANQVERVLAIDGVVAVQADEQREILTDSSIGFIGADTLYPSLGGASDAGKGTIIGIVDTGGWPEHPSFADHGNLDPPPGPARECNFGPDPTSEDDTPFQCNNKLIGGHPFLDTYHEQLGNELFPFTARDGNGHGTHVGSTAAGNVLDSAPVMGAEHGPVQGVAPGAWVVHYRACGVTSCFVSDTSAAIQQAILDGVNVINFSIGGGANPFLDPVSLAMLDAYAAGVFVSASAGNSGPGAGTTNHRAPWVTTVAASTQVREFTSTITLAAGTDNAQFQGVSITGGVDAPVPVVMARDTAAYGNDALCLNPADEGVFEGVIVACERGVIARVLKGFNVLQGGAVGMILYNPVLMDTASDNHWLPAVHLADGTDFVAFMDAHAGETVLGSFTAGQKSDGQGNVMATFSSRGPGGMHIKPDITAPGVQILAGDIPIEGDPADGGGPAGEFFQAINGTSMSAPHVAGSALLLKALHPDWTPGQIKSALMTTARPDVVKEDLTTPADPFDYGSGHVDLTVAGSPGLTIDDTATNMALLGGDPTTAVHINYPSINAPVMPGLLTTTRTLQNVTGQAQAYRVQTDAPAETRIRVTPSSLIIPPGQTRTLTIEITATAAAPQAQHFGEIRLVPQRAGLPTQHLPVAFIPQQGVVTLSSDCDPDAINLLGSSTCTVTATNHAFVDATVDLHTSTNSHLVVTGVDGATQTGLRTVEATGVHLNAAAPPVPSVDPGSSPVGFFSMANLGIAPIPIEDEQIINFNLPLAFSYGSQEYTRIGMVENGYAVVGGGTGADVRFAPPGMPNPAPPNNVLAPFWSDFDGTFATGVYAAIVTVGGVPYLVLEWAVKPWGFPDATEQTFQLWIGLGGPEDISYAYDPGNMPTSPWPFEVGAENFDGSAGDSLGINVAPAGDLRVTTSAPVPGGSHSYNLTVRGILPGSGTVTSTMTSDIVPGVTVVGSTIQIG
jgi:subtilisin family serine protease